MTPTPIPIDTGSTAWLLISTALVMLMVPGLALFYGGMVQRKNVLSTFMHSFMALGIVSVQWVLFGYSLSFGATNGGFIGGFEYAGLNGVGMESGPLSPGIPHVLFMMFQGMFAIITPALISGAYAERMKFSAYVAFTLLWATLVYDPMAHWIWGPGGWIGSMSPTPRDFAGGMVVHLASGVSALIVAIVIGKRAGYPQKPHQPHNLTMTLIGAGLLWFGWFGFNGGSALASGGQAGSALVNTHLAAAAGVLGWVVVEYIRIRKVTMLGVASGLVAGLVGITPAAGYVSPMSALLIGFMTGLVCYGGVMLKGRFGYDDTLDAFGVHGVGGIFGAVATGVFASVAWGSPALTTVDGVTSGSGEGLLGGGTSLFMNQLISIGAAAAFSAVMTFVILKVIQATIGLRVDKDVEAEGLDATLHGESGYVLGDSPSGHLVPHPVAEEASPIAVATLATEVPQT